MQTNQTISRTEKIEQKFHEDHLDILAIHNIIYCLDY